MIDLNEIAEKALKNATERQKNGAHINADTYPMLKHCATEIVEATEAYTLSRNVINPSLTSKFISELADIICCVLIIAANEEIDIEKAIDGCIEKNRLRAEGKGDKK